MASLRNDQKKDIAVLKQELESTIAKTNCDTIKKLEDQMQESFKHYEEKVAALEGLLKKERQKNSLLIETLNYNSQITEDITRRLDMIELNQAKRSAVLSGLEFSAKKNDRESELKDFFSETLHELVDIEDSYFIGESNPKSVVITFNSASERRRIFAVKKNLQHFEGVNGQAIYLNEYLPPSTSEKRKRERDIKKLGQNSDPVVKTEYTDKGFTVGSSIYRKMVTCPPPTALLELEPDELDRILTLDVVRGEQIKVEDSIFLAYSADIKSFQQARDVYLKIKLMHARARYIACSYMLPGQPIWRNQDFDDNEDYGAGRSILQWMQNNDLINKAIYVVRFCGRNKLGAKRLTSYVNAACSVMNVNNYNSVLGRPQTVTANTAQKGQPGMNKHRYTTGGARQPKNSDKPRKKYVVVKKNLRGGIRGRGNRWGTKQHYQLSQNGGESNNNRGTDDQDALD